MTDLKPAELVKAYGELTATPVKEANPALPFRSVVLITVQFSPAGPHTGLPDRAGEYHYTNQTARIIHFTLGQGRNVLIWR